MSSTVSTTLMSAEAPEYHPSMHCGTGTLHIENPSLIEQITSAECGHQFQSDIYIIAQLSWRIQLCPNGYSSDTEGMCAVYARLLNMPSAWKSIFVQIYIECPQLDCKEFSTVSYSKAPKSCGMFVTSFDAFTKLQQSASTLKQLSFIVSINIVRITLNGFPGQSVLYSSPTPRYRKNIEYVWQLDKRTMEQLKTYVRPQGMCSEIIHDIWTLRLYPNGNWNSLDGDVVICVRLCGLPAHISSLLVQCKLQVQPAGVQQSFTKQFSEPFRYCFWKRHTMSFRDFVKYDSLSIKFNLSVLHEYDLDANDITTQRIHEDWKHYTSLRSEKNTSAAEMAYDPMQPLQAPVGGLVARLPAKEDMYTNLLSKQDEMATEIRMLQQKVKQLSMLVQPSNGSGVLGVLGQDDDVEKIVARTSGQAEVLQWLEVEVKMPEYFELFIANGFEDMETVRCLTMDVLNSMSIDKIGHKMKLLSHVGKLNFCAGDSDFSGYPSLVYI